MRKLIGTDQLCGFGYGEEPQLPYTPRLLRFSPERGEQDLLVLEVVPYQPLPYINLGIYPRIPIDYMGRDGRDILLHRFADSDEIIFRRSKKQPDLGRVQIKNLPSTHFKRAIAILFSVEPSQSLVITDGACEAIENYAMLLTQYPKLCDRFPRDLSIDDF